MLLDALSEVTGMSYWLLQWYKSYSKWMSTDDNKNTRAMLTFRGICMSGSLWYGNGSGKPGMCGGFVQLASPAGMVCWQDKLELAITGSSLCILEVVLPVLRAKHMHMHGLLRGGIGFGSPRPGTCGFIHLGSPAGRVSWQDNPTNCLSCMLEVLFNMFMLNRATHLFTVIGIEKCSTNIDKHRQTSAFLFLTGPQASGLRLWTM